MHILHNTINNRCQLDRKTAKTTNKSKNENRRHRIRNRIPRRPATNCRRPNTINCNRQTQKHTTNHGRRKTSTPTQSRNMQRRNPKTLGRKLVQPIKRTERSPRRNGKKRVPLRPNSRSPRPNRPSKRRYSKSRRETTPIPIRPKKTPTITGLIQFLQTYTLDNCK
jgi:hypothetical protein